MTHCRDCPTVSANIVGQCVISFTSDLSPSVHISEIACKGHKRANAILRCFFASASICDVGAYVRRLIKFNNVIWSRHLIAYVTFKLLKKYNGFSRRDL